MMNKVMKENLKSYYEQAIVRQEAAIWSIARPLFGDDAERAEELLERLKISHNLEDASAFKELTQKHEIMLVVTPERTGHKIMHVVHQGKEVGGVEML